MAKFAFKPEFAGSVIQFSHIRGIITLNERTSQNELELLMRANHPAVFVMETKKESKPKEEKE
jgi:hypothetical protein